MPDGKRDFQLIPSPMPSNPLWLQNDDDKVSGIHCKSISRLRKVRPGGTTLQVKFSIRMRDCICF